LYGKSLAITLWLALWAWPDLGGQELPKRFPMQTLLLVGAVLLSLGAALATASVVLTLFLRVMSKLR